MDEVMEMKGLTDIPVKEWPGMSPSDGDQRPVARLRPGSDLHARVLTHLRDRIKMSERAMSQFYDRWRWNERRLQAYITLPKYEQLLKQMTDAGEPPKIVSLVLPYSFATQSTIVTYLIHTFAGRKPMFTVGTRQKAATQNAENMERVLQYNSEHTRLVKELYKFLNDSQTYGLGVLKSAWKNIKATRTVRERSQPLVLFGQSFPGEISMSRQEKLIYSGNEIQSVDPFLFFPDPRVPMTEVNRRGEYVFWREFVGRHALKKEEAAGKFAWIDQAGNLPRDKDTDSDRSLRAGGDSTPGTNDRSVVSSSYYKIDQGSVEIIPAELGLGESRRVEKWIFAIANDTQIIQAEPANFDHDMHPVCVSEPLTQGYGFGNLGMSDYLGPFQDGMSWLVNTHIYNVRASLNNMFVVDPMKIEMQDLNQPEPGKLIRLKQSALGEDVRTAITQLQVTDVTRNHLSGDLGTFFAIGEKMSAINENMMGVQASSGRKTATEVRVSSEAGVSRLAAMARLISAQALVDLAEQMCINIQQFMVPEFEITLLGQDPEDQITIDQGMLVGDFHFPVHDGTLPLDKIAMVDVWKELLIGVSQNPILSQRFDIVKMFKWAAELAGARNIESFEIQVKPDEQVLNALGKGQMVPMSGPNTNVQAAPRNPGARLNGAS